MGCCCFLSQQFKTVILWNGSSFSLMSLHCYSSVGIFFFSISIMVSATRDTRQALLQNMQKPGKPHHSTPELLRFFCIMVWVALYRFDCLTVTSRMSSETNWTAVWRTWHHQICVSTHTHTHLSDSAKYSIVSLTPCCLFPKVLCLDISAFTT